jgi:hypothetical protein
VLFESASGLTRYSAHSVSSSPAPPSFFLDLDLRITTELSETHQVALDETNPDKLRKLSEKASFEFSNNASKIIETYCA